MNRKQRENYRNIVDTVRKQIIKEIIRKVFNNWEEIIEWLIEVAQVIQRQLKKPFSKLIEKGFYNLFMVVAKPKNSITILSHCKYTDNNSKNQDVTTVTAVTA